MARRSYLGELELMVLVAIMRLGEDAYGVPISRELEAHSGREIAFGSVYAALDRLEEKGLVVSTLGEPTAERGGRAKRYFQATEQGIREVRETRRLFASLWKGVAALKGETA